MSGMSISSQQNCRHHSQDLHLCLELNIGHVTAQVSMVPREIRMADFPPSALLLGGCCMGLGSRSHRFSLLRRPGSQPLLQCCWHLSPCKQGQQWQGKDSCRTVPSLQGAEQQQRKWHMCEESEDFVQEQTYPPFPAIPASFSGWPCPLPFHCLPSSSSIPSVTGTSNLWAGHGSCPSCALWENLAEDYLDVTLRTVPIVNAET